MEAKRTGKLIRESRMKKEMTQQTLADAINVSAAAISKWENGHSLPDITMLEPLSSALDISISELVLGERSEKKVENIVDTVKNQKQEAAIKSVIGESIRQRKLAYPICSRLQKHINRGSCRSPVYAIVSSYDFVIRAAVPISAPAAASGQCHSHTCLFSGFLTVSLQILIKISAVRLTDPEGASA